MAEVLHIGDDVDFEHDIENTFGITLIPLDFFDDWERGSLVANFAADYFRHNFPGESEHNLISTVLNELIENAVKFSRNNSQAVKIELRKRKRFLLIRAVNTLPRHREEPFVAVCRELYEGDLDELYIRRLEENAETPASSGIGLILIKKDYCRGLSFDFFSDDNKNAAVAVTAELDFGEGRA